MNIHEYQAKSLLAKFGVPAPQGHVAYTPDEAENAARELGGPIWVVKSQIHAGALVARLRGSKRGPRVAGIRPALHVGVRRVVMLHHLQQQHHPGEIEVGNGEAVSQQIFTFRQVRLVWPQGHKLGRCVASL